MRFISTIPTLKFIVKNKRTVRNQITGEVIEDIPGVVAEFKNMQFKTSNPETIRAIAAKIVDLRDRGVTPTFKPHPEDIAEFNIYLQQQGAKEESHSLPVVLSGEETGEEFTPTGAAPEKGQEIVEQKPASSDSETLNQLVETVTMLAESLAKIQEQVNKQKPQRASKRRSAPKKRAARAAAPSEPATNP